MLDLPAENGIVAVESHHSVDETLERLKQALETKAIKLFAVIDHSGEAANAGLQMPETKLAIFGNPKAGTPLMIAAPTIAIDLPMKILISQDAGGKVWIRYNSADFLGRRHKLPAEVTGPLGAVAALATTIAS